MRVYDVEQGSDEWHALRLRPTASNFKRIITTVHGTYATGAITYACEIASKRLYADKVHGEQLPSFWMQWGSENEDNAVEAYERINEVATQRVGFVTPDATDLFGCSPDRLVGEDGMVQIKCPSPAVLIKYKVDGCLPAEYKQQVQGELMICEREWSDFFAWHPQVEPFQVRVYPDEEYQKLLLKGIEKFLGVLENVMKHAGEPTIDWS